MTTQGYVIQANSLQELECAELLANSIKIKNKDKSVCLISNKSVESECFDDIVNYKFNSKDITRMNDWQLYWTSPYDYTIVLDCKSLVMENHDSLWDYLIDHHDVCFPSVCVDFRNNILQDKKFVPYAEEYNLKKIYSNMFYFNKSDNALRYFKLLDPLLQNWRETEDNFLSQKHRNLNLDIDLIHTIVANHIDVDVFPMHDNILSLVNMNICQQDGLFSNNETWTDILNVWSIDGYKLKIQNYIINQTLYYHEDSFYNEDIANDFRNYRSYTTT